MAMALTPAPATDPANKYSYTAIDESIDCKPRIPTGGREEELN